MPESRKPLTAADVAKVAQLAMLELTEDEVTTFTSQLDAVLDLAGELDAFDLTGDGADIAPTAHPFGLTNVFRADEAAPEAVTETLREDALASGPVVEDHQYRVPPALGEAP